MANTTAKRRQRADARKESAVVGMRKYREAMRRRGFKLVQIWVPDVKAPGFADDLKRQLRALATHPDGAADDFSTAALSNVWDDPEWKA